MKSFHVPRLLQIANSTKEVVLLLNLFVGCSLCLSVSRIMELLARFYCDLFERCSIVKRKTQIGWFKMYIFNANKCYSQGKEHLEPKKPTLTVKGSWTPNHLLFLTFSLIYCRIVHYQQNVVTLSWIDASYIYPQFHTCILNQQWITWNNL